ncbi:Uncharacterized protein OBRU01_09661 [Operophtera brumata]|uniref:Uncharacterized protein n=1 Tax=Operophtera brumata TaxID=104452 RepID=A0A0L7LEW5_OPEBR|nr:Uncharacterized protein OBRU01_09661 [Operophtera brumata]
MRQARCVRGAVVQTARHAARAGAVLHARVPRARRLPRVSLRAAQRDRTVSVLACVKRAVCVVLSRTQRGTLPVQELFFTREYHGPAGYRARATAPPNEIAL